MTDLRTAGREARARVPRGAHAAWAPADDRADPLVILRRLEQGWSADLVALRYERMCASPLAFLRGAAAIMAADLAVTPASGLLVQAVGDAHLLNFGGFGSAEHRLLFDVNDFDETLRAPWEWDLKRLAASVAVAARELDLDQDTARDAARGYREAMTRYATMTPLEVHADELEAADAPGLAGDARRWSHRTNAWELPKLTTGGALQIALAPPVTERCTPADEAALRALPDGYVERLAPDRRVLLARYEVVDAARHAVGIGSFGTRCYVVLLRGRHTGDPLFLQVKEARPSALGRSPVHHHGERVVAGQLLCQPGADPLLGACTMPGFPAYVRQLRDMRGGVDLARFDAASLRSYAALCGAALARAHARTGEPAAIAGYIGTSDRIDRAIGRFARAYAEQTERDHAALVAGVPI